MGLYRSVFAELPCLRCGALYRVDVQFKTGRDRLESYDAGSVALDVPTSSQYTGIARAWCERCMGAAPHHDGDAYREDLCVATDSRGVIRVLVEPELPAFTIPASHRRVLGLPLPQKLVELIANGAWASGLTDGLRYETGWLRDLETYLLPDDIEAMMRRVQAASTEAQLAMGFGPGSVDLLDPRRSLVIATNRDGRMIALDYRVDPPRVMSRSEDARWTSLFDRFELFASAHCTHDSTP